jgi:anti-sigma B factor antagonist
MKLTVEHHEDVTILRLAGQMTIGEGDIQFREVVTEQLMRGDKKFLVDLKLLKYLDSAGLGEMVRAYTTVRKAGGNMRLIYLLDKARELFTVTRLISVFEHYDSEEEALAAFDKDKKNQPA